MWDCEGCFKRGTLCGDAGATPSAVIHGCVAKCMNICGVNLFRFQHMLLDAVAGECAAETVSRVRKLSENVCLCAFEFA